MLRNQYLKKQSLRLKNSNCRLPLKNQKYAKKETQVLDVYYHTLLLGQDTRDMTNVN